MSYKVLRKGDNYRVFGHEYDGEEYIDSLVVLHRDSTTYFSPVIIRKRTLKNWFRKPTFHEAQNKWLDECLKQMGERNA